MFKELETKAREMIANSEDEMALTMWVDGYYVTAVITVSEPGETVDVPEELIK